MTAENFVYWLQGFFEIDGTDDQKREGLTKEQCEMIKKHLSYVFNNMQQKAVPGLDEETIRKLVLPFSHSETLIC